MTGTPKKLFYGIAVIGCIIGVIMGLMITYNSNNYVENKVCVDYEGSEKYDIQYADGSCNQYEYVKGRENLLVPILLYGGAGAFVGGWLGLFVATGYEKYEQTKDKKNSKTKEDK